MKDPQSTYDTYHQLLKNGFEEEQAIQLLTYTVGVQIESILADQQPFDETHWNEMMELLSERYYTSYMAYRNRLIINRTTTDSYGKESSALFLLTIT